MKPCAPKYKVGDVVSLKPKFILKVRMPGSKKDLPVKTVVISECRFHQGKPVYKFEGFPSYYYERCITSKAPWSFLNDL